MINGSGPSHVHLWVFFVCFYLFVFIWFYNETNVSRFICFVVWKKWELCLHCTLSMQIKPILFKQMKSERHLPLTKNKKLFISHAHSKVEAISVATNVSVMLIPQLSLGCWSTAGLECKDLWIQSCTVFKRQTRLSTLQTKASAEVPWKCILSNAHSIHVYTEEICS